MTSRFLALALTVVLLSTAAQAQNVMVPGLSAKTAQPNPSPAVPEAKKPENLWGLLPSTPVPSPTVSRDDSEDYFRVPPAQLSGLLSMQKSAQSTLGQALSQIQEQRDANDVELKNNPTPQRRAEIMKENQSIDQNILSLKNEMQKTERRINVMQSGNVSINELSLLYNQ